MSMSVQKMRQNYSSAHLCDTNANERAGGKGNGMSGVEYVPQQQAMAEAAKIAERNTEVLNRLSGIKPDLVNSPAHREHELQPWQRSQIHRQGWPQRP